MTEECSYEGHLLKAKGSQDVLETHQNERSEHDLPSLQSFAHRDRSFWRASHRLCCLQSLDLAKQPKRHYGLAGRRSHSAEKACWQLAQRKPREGEGGAQVTSPGGCWGERWGIGLIPNQPRAASE